MLLIAAMYSLGRRPDPRKHLSEGPQTGSDRDRQKDPEFPVTAEVVLPSGLNPMRKVNVHRCRSRQSRGELHEQIPDEGI